jgi:hypothetical protein
MKNSITCLNCKSENPFYRATCTNCKSYLRDRVYNLDLWKTIALLIENPAQAFRLIVFSEQKNFIIFILIFAAPKYLINSRFAAMLTLREFQSTTGLLISLILVLAVITAFVFLYALIFTLTARTFSLQTRFKDNLAILSYVQIAHVLGLFVLFPVELIIFGDYIFSINPSPFVIKELLAYILLCVELLVILWSIFLSFFAFYTQTKNFVAGLINTIIFNGLLFAIVFFLSTTVFTI